MIQIPTKLLTDRAQLPTYGSDKAAGMDLYADMTTMPFNRRTLAPGERCAVPTGVSVAIPEGYYGRIAPRSGLAFKNGVDVLAGVIDNDYRGEIKAILVNLGDEDFVIMHGDRTAQMIITPYAAAQVEVVDNLDDTQRGSGGFGSTGN